MQLDLTKFVLVTRDDIKPKRQLLHPAEPMIAWRICHHDRMYLNSTALDLINFDEVAVDITAKELNDLGVRTSTNELFTFKNERKACLARVCRHATENNRLVITIVPLSKTTIIPANEQQEYFVILSATPGTAIIYCSSKVFSTRRPEGATAFRSPLMTVVRNNGHTVLYAGKFAWVRGRRGKGSVEVPGVDTPELEEPLNEDLPATDNE